MAAAIAWVGSGAGMIPSYKPYNIVRHVIQPVTTRPGDLDAGATHLTSLELLA